MRGTTNTLGDAAESLAADLLRQRGYRVTDLNMIMRNRPVIDLEVEAGEGRFPISVKAARLRTGVRLGSVSSLSALPENGFLFIFMPMTKAAPLDLECGSYALWIVPAPVRREALDAHQHYATSHPGSANHSVMIKDKVDRGVQTRSGAVFKSWEARFTGAWHLLPPA